MRPVSSPDAIQENIEKAIPPMDQRHEESNPVLPFFN